MTTPSAETTGPASTRRGWLHPTVVSVAAIAVGAGFAQFGVTTVLGDVAVTFGAAETEEQLAAQVGLSATTLGVGLAVIRLAGMGSLVAAALADRFGRRRLLLVSVALGLALTAIAGASTGFWMFVAIVAAARPLLSGSNALVAVVAAEETRTRDRSKAMALVQAAYAGGSGVVAILHGIGDGAISFRVIFALALVPLVALPLLARRLEEPPLFAAETHRPAMPGAVERALWPRLAIVAGLAAATALVTGPSLTYLFVYGENVLGATPGFMAVLVLAAGPVGLVGLLIGRWAADHLGRRVAAGTAMALIAAGGTLTYLGTVPTLAAGYLLNITAGGAFGPAAGALLAEVFPTRARATANGWVAAVGVLGAVLGLAAFGALADLFDSFSTAGIVLWLPTMPLAFGYALLPETRHAELDHLDDAV